MMSEIGDFPAWERSLEAHVDAEDGRRLQAPDGGSMYQPPAVRLTAYYPCADGTGPEQVELTWETAFPSVEVLIALARELRLGGR